MIFKIKLSETSVNELDRQLLQNNVHNIEFQQHLLNSQRESFTMTDSQRETLIRNKYINIEMRKREIKNKLREDRLKSVERRDYQSKLQNLYTEERNLDHQRSLIENVSEKESASKKESVSVVESKYQQLETQKQQIQNKLNEINLSEIDKQVYQRNLENIETQQRILQPQETVKDNEKLLI